MDINNVEMNMPLIQEAELRNREIRCNLKKPI